MDAYEVPDFDFKVVTRLAENTDAQRWVIIPL
jgi:hypothetical protein